MFAARTIFRSPSAKILSTDFLKPSISRAKMSTIPAIQANPAITWSRLIRFKDADGKVYNGEPIVEENENDVGILAQKGTLKAKIITGDVFDNAKVTDEVVEVKTLLGPLAVEQVPIIRCVGLNYMKHSKFFCPLRMRRN